jgi:hypothetical protein
MEVDPNAKMADIQIISVPFGWSGYAPKRELSNPDNRSVVKLIHRPSGTTYSVAVPEQVISWAEAAEYRARARIRFIHELHGESWLNDPGERENA